MSARALLPLLLLAACAPSPRAGEDAAAAAGTVVQEYQPCYGTCPVYKLTITAGGEVSFTGRAHVDSLGAHAGALPRERFAELLGQLRERGFFELADRYTMGEPACGAYHTDAPRVITIVTVGDSEKRIEHDYGCTGAPAKLAELERLVREAAGVARWVGGRH